MPAPATAARAELAPVLPAAASRAILRILQGPAAPAASLGTSSGTTWLQAAGQVLALSGPDSVRLPNEVALPGLRPSPEPVGQWVVGGGGLHLGEVEFGVTRWWDPRPALGTLTPQTLADISDQARPLLGCDHLGPLGSSLSAGDDLAVCTAMRLLLGKGPGLTPEGDDVLVGVLAGLRLLGPAVGSLGAAQLLAALAPIVAIEAPIRTTALSATLLRHAWKGEVAGPLAALFRALTGRGDIGAAVGLLRSMGATSGVAMGCGALLAADCVVKGALRDR